jgi:hypothetical protein
MMMIILSRRRRHYRIWLVVVRSITEVLPFGTSLCLPFNQPLLISPNLPPACLPLPHHPAYYRLRLHLGQ